MYARWRFYNFTEAPKSELGTQKKKLCFILTIFFLQKIINDNFRKKIVILPYRIFAGESSTDPLGSGQQTAQIGQVMTGFSTICVRAEYRTQMTITPCMVNLGCSDPNVSGSSSSQTSAQQASNWVKSDHFISAENLDNAGIVRRNVNNPDYDRFGEGNPVTTSDESSEAMRIFAASPPDNFIHRRFSDHYSSNESLGVQQRFRSSKSEYILMFAIFALLISFRVKYKSITKKRRS